MWKKFIFEGEETNYSVSDDGYVRNDNTNKILKGSPYQGYFTVGLSIHGKPKRMRIHRMVALTYIPKDTSDGVYRDYVNHINGDRGDNRVENLEWVT